MPPGCHYLYKHISHLSESLPSQLCLLWFQHSVQCKHWEQNAKPSCGKHPPTVVNTLRLPIILPLTLQYIILATSLPHNLNVRCSQLRADSMIIIHNQSSLSILLCPLACAGGSCAVPSSRTEPRSGPSWSWQLESTQKWAYSPPGWLNQLGVIQHASSFNQSQESDPVKHVSKTWWKITQHA